MKLVNIVYYHAIQESGLEKVFIPRLSLWYTADFGRDMKSKISKLLLMSPIGGRSYAVLTELLEKYKECGGKNIFFVLLFLFCLYYCVILFVLLCHFVCIIVSFCSS
jgi:hypothetical protein